MTMLSRTQYIQQFKDEAIRSTRGTGLFASLMLAQGILESNNGNSVNRVTSNQVMAST